MNRNHIITSHTQSYVYMHVHVHSCVYLELGLQTLARSMFLTSALAWLQSPTPTGAYMCIYSISQALHMCMYVNTCVSVYAYACKQQTTDRLSFPPLGVIVSNIEIIIQNLIMKIIVHNAVGLRINTLPMSNSSTRRGERRNVYKNTYVYVNYVQWLLWSG